MKKTLQDKSTSQMLNGFSLIEMLVVIGIFAVLGAVSSQALLLSLTSTRKADASTVVRQNLEFAVSVMERHLRGARSLVTTCTAGQTIQTVTYIDSWGYTNSFSCNPPSQDYIASGSARLTSSQLTITSCSFTCTPGTNGAPPSIYIQATGRASSAGFSSTETTPTSVSARVTLRSY